MDLKKFYKYAKIQPSAYCDSIFNHYNKPETLGFITFRDFVVCLWNYCTLSVPNVVDYVFAVYDADGSKDIDLDEAKILITDLYGEKYLKNPEAKR
jgi:Ca2+-binding EF-hand superfamily protein